MRKPHLFIQQECWPAACRDIKRQTSTKDFKTQEVDLPVVLECQQQTKSLIEICQIWRIFLYLFCATLSTTDYSVHFWKAKCIVMTECFFFLSGSLTGHTYIWKANRRLLQKSTATYQKSHRFRWATWLRQLKLMAVFVTPPNFGSEPKCAEDHAWLYLLCSNTIRCIWL